MFKKNILFIPCLWLLLLKAAISYDGHPQRIISLGPALTEEIYLLGASDKLVGCTAYCTKPSEAKKKEKVGSIIEVNLEKILLLKPDMVLTTSLTKPETKEKLKQLGINYTEFPYPKDFDEICGQFLRLGQLIGKEITAGEIVDKAKKEVELIKRKTAALPKQKVFIQIGSKPLVTATKDSFINDFIEFSGGENIAKNAGNNRYSREKVIENDPEVILISTMGEDSRNAGQESDSWISYKTIKAARTGRIHIVDSNLFCSPTPVTFVSALKVIAGFLHQEDCMKNE